MLNNTFISIGTKGLFTIINIFTSVKRCAFSDLTPPPSPKCTTNNVDLINVPSTFIISKRVHCYLPPPLANGLYACENVDNCERPLRSLKKW